MSLPLFILTLFSTFFILLPFSFALIYWIKRGFFFDQKVNLIVIFIAATVFLHAWVTYLAFNATNNIFLIRAIHYVDMFFLGLFLLSLFFDSLLTRFSVNLILIVAIFLIDFGLGVHETSPTEQGTAVSVILIWLVILVVKKINYSEVRGKAYSYFVLAIVIGAINNLSVNIIDIQPQLFVFITAISNIVCNIFYTLGFYTLLKKIKPQDNF